MNQQSPFMIKVDGNAMKRRLNGYWSTFLGPGLVYLECKFYLVNTIYVELKYIGKQAFLRIRFFHNKEITDVFAVVPLEKLDDLSSKYGIANENAVSAKKRNKKIKSRPLDIEFPLHGNGLTRCVFFFLTFWLFACKFWPNFCVTVFVGNC